MLEKPMIGLAFVWLVLVVVDLVYGLSPLWQTISTIIWVIFVCEFSFRLFLAPKKVRFFEKNWLTALSLLVPALRIFRPLRFLAYARAARGSQIVRVVGTMNRGMKALSRAMGRKGFGFVTVLTLVVAFSGAAGMYAFERGDRGGGFSNFPDALWWTAMQITTAGSGYTPATNEGRILAFLISLYAFSVFGYLAATLASFLVERDAKAKDSPTVGQEQILELAKEVKSLRAALERRG